jgi:hypothetical protein
MPIDVTTLITDYADAWCEPNPAARKALLDRCWAEDGTYTDPTADIAGRQQLVEHIGGFFERFPGARIARTSAVDAHHGMLRFTWRMVLSDGQVFTEGIDFGRLSPDGRLAGIVGFFGPVAPLP